MRNKLGIIDLSWDYFLDDVLFDEVIKPLSKRIVVLETKHDLLADKITYKCFCEDFDVLEVGEIIQNYKVTFHSDNLEPFKITFERKENADSVSVS